MKRVVATLLVASIALVGCESNKEGNFQPSPSALPSASESQTTKPSEPSKSLPPSETPDAPKPEPTTVKPAPVTTTTEAGTPATQFAQRWGLKYPSVPEYAILKAAKGTCLLIQQGGRDWIDDPQIVKGIEEVISGFGLDKSDTITFAQDAEQNYCSSIANPT